MGLDIPFIGTALTAMVKTIPLTLAMTFFPLLFGFLIAILMSFIQIKHVRILEPISKFYVSFFRSTPAILHIMLIYLGIPLIVDKLSTHFDLGLSANKIPVAIFVIIALSFTAGSYLTESIRSGIIAVDAGQIEAAYSIGMTHREMLQRVLFPQAFIIALPNFTNLAIGFLHTTSIAAIVAVPEITGTATIVASDNYAFLEAFIAAAIIYWLLTMIIEAIHALLEKKLTVYQGGVR